MVKITIKMLILCNFEASFDSLLCKKNKFLDGVKSSIKDRLSEVIEKQ